MAYPVGGRRSCARPRLRAVDVDAARGKLPIARRVKMPRRVAPGSAPMTARYMPAGNRVSQPVPLQAALLSCPRLSASRRGSSTRFHSWRIPVRSLILAAGLLAAGLAGAADTYRSGSRVITVGDSAAKLTQVVGTPTLKEPIESRQGGRVGERWQYAIDGKTVTFEIRDGKVTSIDERRD